MKVAKPMQVVVPIPFICTNHAARFNSFLDIWSLAVGGTGFSLPPPWLRMVLGFLAAVGWPLGAYWAIERRKVPAAVALGAGLLTVVLAVVTTVVWSG